MCVVTQCAHEKKKFSIQIKIRCASQTADWNWEIERDKKNVMSLFDSEE